jgi:hypothetical protein
MTERDDDKGQSFSPATSLVTWALAFVFLIGIDVALTRTSILWGPTAFENSGGIRTVFPQTYQVLRKIYAPVRQGDERVALLGNSRLALAIKDFGVESAIDDLQPGRDIVVDNLAIFGAFVGDTAILARHLDALDPDLVVVTIGGMELGRAALNPNAKGPSSLLEIGFAGAPIFDPSITARLDRWARTVWPLYRFREFLREAILDDLLGRPDPGPPPERFATRMDLFRHLYGERAQSVWDAHSGFLADQTLDNFTAYVNAVGPEHLKRQRERVRTALPIDASSAAIVTLDWFLTEMAASDRKVVMLLMPENPILAQDAAKELHRPGRLAYAAKLASELAAKHRIPVIDARAWLPASAFLDFHHPIFEPERFERLLAKEILNALDS